MKRLISLMVCTVIGLSAIGAQAASQHNCALTRPPPQAAVTETDGRFFFVFPRVIGRRYSGCQTMWDENGKAWFNLAFRSGVLIKYTRNVTDDGKRLVVCIYEAGLLSKQSPSDCPAFESVKNGFTSIDKAHEPSIPPTRDPRK